MTNVKIEDEITWYLPPTKNKHGIAKRPYDTVKLYLGKTNLFKRPVIMTSDLHAHTSEIFRRLEDYLKLSEFFVLTLGDMAGLYVYGSDGNPTDCYKKISTKAQALYFVQGNHDLPSDELIKLTNKDGSACMIKSGAVQKTPLGSIGGINGIISSKEHPYKMSEQEYFGFFKSLFQKKRNLYLLMTHLTPTLSIPDEKINYIGNKRLFEMVCKYKPKIHIFGHCHHPSIVNSYRNTTFINVDGRIVILVPETK